MIHKWLSTLVVLLFLCVDVMAQPAKLDVVVGYLEVRQPRPAVLSNLEDIPDNEGLAGAHVALNDNNTTGKFLGQTYKLESHVLDEDADGLAEAKALLAKTPYVIINATSDKLAKIAALPEAANALLFNASNRDVEMRDRACLANVLHTIPSRAMLADALSQFAIKKRWTNWVMIEGARVGDEAFAVALEKSAKKFQIKINEKKKWIFDADMRRNAAQEVPLFTQDFPDYDLLVIADEPHDFGRYVMFNTWLPRPIAGSEGIVPSAWSASVEQHGASQLQSRFRKHAKRAMRSIDYAAWAAMRTIGEAVTRTSSSEAAQLREFIFSDKFQLAGFKGRPLTYRNWNGQLRQPIPLTHPRAVVALAPLEGFLHRSNPLDTLGIDKAESQCTAFGED